MPSGSVEGGGNVGGVWPKAAVLAEKASAHESALKNIDMCDPAAFPSRDFTRLFDGTLGKSGSPQPVGAGASDSDGKAIRQANLGASSPPITGWPARLTHTWALSPFASSCATP